MMSFLTLTSVTVDVAPAGIATPYCLRRELSLGASSVRPGPILTSTPSDVPGMSIFKVTRLPSKKLRNADSFCAAAIMGQLANTAQTSAIVERRDTGHLRQAIILAPS